MQESEAPRRVVFSEETVRTGTKKFNIEHGTYLQYHSEKIQPELAAALSKAIDFKVCFGAHGSPENSETLPHELLYQQIQDAIDILDPARGDKLFVEEAGHNGICRDLGLIPHMKPGALDRLRKGQVIDTFQYGVMLAASLNIPVVPADINAYEVSLPFSGLDLSPDKIMEEWTQRPDLDVWRIQRAVSTVKDAAVQDLPAIDPEVRPTYMLLIGYGHEEEVIRQYSQMNLQLAQIIAPSKEQIFEQELAIKLKRMDRAIEKLGGSSLANRFGAKRIRPQTGSRVFRPHDPDK